jgi:hypothetical protein
MVEVSKMITACTTTTSSSADDSLCLDGNGTNIFKAIIRYLKRTAGVKYIQIKWVPYLNNGIADAASKATQFFVDKLHFEISTSKHGLSYLSLDVVKHY